MNQKHKTCLKILAFLLAILTLLSTLLLPTAAADKPAVDKEQLATDLLREISTQSHPYILYTTDELPALREKITTGYSKKAFDFVKQTAATYLGASISVSQSSAGIIGRQLQSYVAYLCLYGELIETDKSFYINKAKSLVLTAVQNGTTDIYHEINDALCVADFGYAYALAYDWLYPYLTDGERDLLRDEMEEIGFYLYNNSTAVNTWGSSEARRQAWNWNAVTHGALGMIALSLGSHSDWLELAIERTLGYYTYAVDETGAAMEGLHYIGYAFNTLAVFDCVIYDLTGVELLDAFPAMQAITSFSMNMTAPYGGDQAAINQGDELGNYAATYYIINRYQQQEALWGWEQTHELAGEGTFTSDYMGNGWNAPAIIFYEDKALKPVMPTDTEGLNVTTYERGLVAAREDWNPQSSMLTFTCGYGYAGCWNHPDDNSFTFYAKGDAFIIDLGANYKKSTEHNLLSVDGVGMDYEGGPTMVAGTLEENKLLENGALYLRGNNTNSYAKKAALTDSRRQLIYAGGETPFVLVYDYAKKDDAEHVYTTNFYTDDASLLSVNYRWDYACIQGGNSKQRCYVYAYSDEGVSFNTKNKNGVKAIVTENTAVEQAQATLFILANPDGSMPKVVWSKDDNGILTAEIIRVANGATIKDTYVLSNTELLEYSSEPYIEESETEPSTEPATEPSTTEEITVPDNTESNGGCGSAHTVALVLPLAALSCLLFMIPKRKKAKD